MIFPNQYAKAFRPDRNLIEHRSILAPEAAFRIEEALEFCLTMALSVIGVDSGGLYIKDEQGNYKLACHKGLPAGYIEENWFFHRDSELVEFLSTGLPLFKEYDPMDPKTTTDTPGEGLQCAAIVPLVHKGQMIGMLNIASRVRERVTPLCRRALKTLASQTASTLAHIYTEAQRKWGQELFAIAFQNSPQWISITTLKEGIFVEVNEGFCRMSGYSRSDVIGRNPQELRLWPPGTKEEFAKAIEQKKEIKNYEVPLCRKDGTILNVLVSAKLVDLYGEACLVTIVTDITDLRKFEGRLARLDKLNLAGEIAAGIGHEVRNPMTTVRGFLQLLACKEEYADDLEYFDLMIEELDRSNAILTEFLSLAKDKWVDLKDKNLNNIITGISPLIQATALLNDLKIHLDLHTIPNQCIDEKEMRQLVLNLAQNGLEAMTPGGTLCIRTCLKDNHVALLVGDQGHGIDPDLLERLGTPFQTTKDNSTGLGLAVCYSIANRHSAEIKIHTGPSGTTVEVLFPIS